MQSPSARRRRKKGASESDLSAEELKTNQDIGLSRGGKNTKIHALVDGLGNPIRLIFTGGEVHDSKQAIPLLEGFGLAGSAVLGDKAFGTVKILAFIRNNGGIVVIPPKSNSVSPWDCDYYHYKERHLVECFFNKLKHFRRVATRYDKLSTMFQAFTYLACIMIWLK
jgi:transposase